MLFGTVDMIGAFEELENDIDGVLGRGVERRLSVCDDVNVDIRRSHDDLAVPLPVAGKSTWGVV